MVSFKLTALAVAALSAFNVSADAQSSVKSAASVVSASAKSAASQASGSAHSAATDASASAKSAASQVSGSAQSAATQASASAKSAASDIPNIADVKWEDMQKWAESQGDAQWKKDNPSAPAADSAPLSVSVSVSFPDAEIFGVKLVNGRPTRALLSITNNEDVPVTPLAAIGTLLSPKDVPGTPEGVVLRNLTGARFGNEIPPKGKETVTYSFATIMQPRDVTLDVKVLVQRGQRVFTVNAYSEGVSIVEAPVSIFDPQIIFLYLFLLTALGGVSYFIYTTYIATLFPAKPKRRSGGKDGSRAQRSSGGSKPVDSAEGVDVVGADGPAVASGSAVGGKGYDESWIPAGHLQRPTAKRVGSGRVKSRAA